MINTRSHQDSLIFALFFCWCVLLFLGWPSVTQNHHHHHHYHLEILACNQFYELHNTKGLFTHSIYVSSEIFTWRPIPNYFLLFTRCLFLCSSQFYLLFRTGIPLMCPYSVFLFNFLNCNHKMCQWHAPFPMKWLTIKKKWNSPKNTVVVLKCYGFVIKKNCAVPFNSWRLYFGEKYTELAACDSNSMRNQK